MKKLIILSCCLMVTVISYAQSERVNLNNLEYIEWRTTPFQGWQFRTTPNSGFQGMGIMKYKLRSHLKENDEAMKYFRKHNWAITGVVGTSIISSLSLIVLTANLGAGPNQDLTVLAVGGSMLALSYGTAIFLSDAIYKNLQKSIDIYNRDKNPTLSQVEPFIPRLQPSSHSLGLGLVWSIH